MNPVIIFFTKIFLYLQHKKEEYIFLKSKKYIQIWGEGSYGMPIILCLDKKSRVSVGKFVSIANNVTFLLGANHKRGLITTFPIDRVVPSRTITDANEPENIYIGNDVLIGHGATILGPSIIGDGAIIGAGALVVGDVPAYAVVGGVPARILKMRFSDNQIEKLIDISWWNWRKDIIKERLQDIYSKDIDSFISKYGH